MTENDFESNLAMISYVSAALGDTSKEVVFVGGSVVALYIDIKGTPEPAPSIDLDCIVELLNRHEYDDFKAVLRKKGFKDMEPTDDSEIIPTCRMYYHKLKVDIMPVEESILGYANLFYKEGIKYKILRKLPDNTKVYVLPLPFFIATKLKAFFERGINEPLMSQDLEDIVAVMDGSSTFISEINSSSESVKQFVKDSFSKWLNDWDNIYREAIEGNLPYSNKTETALKLKAMLEKLSR